MSRSKELLEKISLAEGRFVLNELTQFGVKIFT